MKLVKYSINEELLNNNLTLDEICNIVREIDGDMLYLEDIVEYILEDDVALILRDADNGNKIVAMSIISKDFKFPEYFTFLFLWVRDKYRQTETTPTILKESLKESIKKVNTQVYTIRSETNRLYKSILGEVVNRRFIKLDHDKVLELTSLLD